MLTALYLLKGDLNAAIEQSKKVIELDPSFPRAHDYLGYAYLKRGQSQDAIAELQKGVEMSGRGSEELSFLGYGYGVLGKRAEAAAVLRELEGRYARGESPAMYPARRCTPASGIRIRRSLGSKGTCRLGPACWLSLPFFRSTTLFGTTHAILTCCGAWDLGKQDR